MTNTNRLAEHLRSVYLDGAWTEAPVRGAFEVLSHAEASARPIAGRHTAWEILLHLDAWHRAVSRRLQGETVDLPPHLDWPKPPESTAENWHAAIVLLDAGLEELVHTIRTLPEGKLLTKLPGGKFTIYETIAGIGEHDLYHAGQVTFLRRVQG